MPIAPLPDAFPRDRQRSMKSAIIKRLPAAGLIYLLLSLLYFGTVGDYGHMYLGYGPRPDPVYLVPELVALGHRARAQSIHQLLRMVSARVQSDLGDLDASCRAADVAAHLAGQRGCVVQRSVVGCTRAERLDGISPGPIPDARHARVVHWRVPVRLLVL